MNSIRNESVSVDASAPMHFCTSLGSSSLPKFITLYWSLLRHCRRPFVFWVLCDGEEVHRLLSVLDLPNSRLVKLSEFEEGDSPLMATKSERDVFEYNCTLRPSWILYLLSGFPEIDILTYMDTDLYFFSDPQALYHQMSDNSIILCEHRYSSNFAILGLNPEQSGVYNAGWLAFKNDERARVALIWWRERCLEWCGRSYEDGKFGEQKYLDNWISQFPGTVAMNLIGGNVAPWNIFDYRVSEDQIKQILINKHLLIFYHFHALQLEEESSFKVVNEVGASVKQLTNPNYILTRQQLKLIYKPYVRELRQAIALTGSLGPVKVGKSEENRTLRRLLPNISRVKRVVMRGRTLVRQMINVFGSS
jgi:hypothetical protein